MMDFTRKVLEFARSDAPWLNEFNWRALKVGVLPMWMPFVGIYLPLFRSVFVKPDDVSESFEFATLIHEYRHAWQCYTMGIFKYTLKKAFCRKVIEEDAETWELKAIGSWPLLEEKEK